jgi:hypothetical protein
VQHRPTPFTKALFQDCGALPEPVRKMVQIKNHREYRYGPDVLFRRHHEHIKDAIVEEEMEKSVHVIHMVFRRGILMFRVLSVL